MNNTTVTFDTQIIDGLTYTLPIIPPNMYDLQATVPMLPGIFKTNTLCNLISATANTVLLHQQLNHTHDCGLCKLHTAVIGVPKITPRQDIDVWDACLACKMRRKNRGNSPTCHAEIPFQGISFDWGFIVQRRKNSERHERLKTLIETLHT